jgi:hypothetical protein
MGFVGKWPLRMQRMVFSKSGGRAAVFGRVQKILVFWTGAAAPARIFRHQKVRGGELNFLHD